MRDTPPSTRERQPTLYSTHLRSTTYLNVYFLVHITYHITHSLTHSLTTKDSSSVHFGFRHRCHKHGRNFDVEHVRTCSLITGCQDIDKYAKMIKEGGNIRSWDQEVLADCIL